MRRKRSPSRKIAPDPKYNSRLIGKFINMVMLKGKKSTAERIVYGALDIINERAKGKQPAEVFQKAVDNVKPLLEVRSRRVGGATYQVPVDVRPERSITLAMRWIRDYAKGRKGKPMAEKVAEEIMDAYKGEGGSIKKREDTHKMAEANKAFSHYRW